MIDCDVYTRVYTYGMSYQATLFKNGGSQAVRLPKDCRFDDDQRVVLIHREGRRVVIEPVDEWSPEFLASLGAWDEPIERPESVPLSDMRDPFA